MFELRDDDILEIGFGSAHHAYRLRVKNAWEWFKEADKVFEEYNYPCTLAVLSEGIDYWKEWVEHIKRNLHRYKIELHGSKHHYYDNMSMEEGLGDLKKARDLLEKEFKTPITTWYVPYGKRHYPKWGEEVCDKLGLNFDATKNPNRIFNFHYWHKEQVEEINEMVKNLCRLTGKK